MLDWPVDSCVFLSLVFLSPRFKSKLKGKHHISSSIIELTNVRFCGLIVGPCVAFLKLVMVGVVAPSTGWAEEVHNADEVSLLCSLIRDVGPLCWSCQLWLFIGSIILIFRCTIQEAFPICWLMTSNNWVNTTLHLMRELEFEMLVFLVLFSIQFCSLVQS